MFTISKFELEKEYPEILQGKNGEEHLKFAYDSSKYFVFTGENAENDAKDFVSQFTYTLFDPAKKEGKIAVSGKRLPKLFESL